MKKILALVLVLILALGLVACGGGGTESAGGGDKPAAESSSGGATQPAAQSGVQQGQSQAAKEILEAEKDTEKKFPNQNEDGTVNLDKVAHFDADFDYAKNAKHEKFSYIAAAGSVLYQLSAAAYEHWCPLFNLEWSDFLSSNGDSDMYLTMLQTKIDEGVKGFVLDPDATIFPSVLSVLEKYPDVFWLSQMAPPRDGATGDGVPVGGNLINNYVGFDNVESGRVVTRRLVEWKNETYPDVPWDEVGFLMMDFSTSPPLHDRYTGSREVFLEAGGKEENFFDADCVSTGMTMQGGLDAAGPVISSHPEITYWLCNGLFDDMGQAAASIFEQQGLGDTSAVCVFGGSALIQQWDAGQEDSFRFAVYTAQTLYAEPIIGGVVAFLNGWATPDNIWPSWVKWDDHGIDGHTYSQLRLPTVPIEHDSYKQYLEWTDLYTHAEAWPYDNDVTVNIDDFSPFVEEVPADYKKP